MKTTELTDKDFHVSVCIKNALLWRWTMKTAELSDKDFLVSVCIKNALYSMGQEDVESAKTSLYTALNRIYREEK